MLLFFGYKNIKQAHKALHKVALWANYFARGCCVNQLLFAFPNDFFIS